MCAAADRLIPAAGLRDAAMISLMSDCLLRISEAVAVDVRDVNSKGFDSVDAETTQRRGMRCCISVNRRGG